MMNCLKVGLVRHASSSQNKSFDRHIHDLLGRLFDRCQMQNVSHAIHRFFYNIAMFDGAVNVFDPRVCFEFAVMTQRSNGEGIEFGIRQQAIDENLSHLTSRTCD